MIKDKSIIKDTAFKIFQAKSDDYISLTNIAKHKSDNPQCSNIKLDEK